MNEPKRTEPSWALHKEPHRYTPSWATNVQATWRKFGWQPKFGFQTKKDEKS